MSRAHRILTPALAAALLVTVLGSAPSSAQPAAPSPASPVGKFVPSSGVLFGAAVATRGGDSRSEAVSRLEGSARRKFDVHRVYDSWADRQPSALLTWSANGGRIPILSIKPRRHGNPVTWSRIASGAEDAQIRAHADGLKRFNKPVFLAFHHEPENDREWGTPAQFAAAYRHYVSVVRSRGANNVAFVWIMMASSFTRWHPVAESYYPGNSYVDWIGGDGYNWFGTRPGKEWRSFADTFTDFKDFGVTKGKPLMIAEVGSLEDRNTPGRKAAWLNDATETIRSWPSIKAMSYFHSPVIYPWWVDSSASATAAFASMGSRLRAVRAD